MLLHLHEYSTYYIDFLYLQLRCNKKLNCNRVLKCDVTNFKSWKQTIASAIFTVHSLHPNDSEVYKITFSLKLFSFRDLPSFEPPKCIFLYFQLKIAVAFFMKESGK